MLYHWGMRSIQAFEIYHPLFVEGMGGYDTRDSERIADIVSASVSAHWRQNSPSKPPLLIIQGDPLEPKGISAITPLVANILQLKRGLIVLDEDLADYHSPNADRNNVVLETRYSEAAAFIEGHRPGTVAKIEGAVDELLAEKTGSVHCLANRRWLTTTEFLRCCRRSQKPRFMRCAASSRLCIPVARLANSR